MSVQTTLFDFLAGQERATQEPKLDHVEVAKKPKVDPELLLRMKEYIKRGILNKSDEYYNVVPGEFEVLETDDFSLSVYENDLRRKDKKLENGTYYDLRFVINSESYKLYKCYQENGKNTTAEDIYKLDMTQTAKDRFVEYMNDHGIDAAMTHFNIWSRPKCFTFARSTEPKELEKIAELVSEFAEYRQRLGFVDLYEQEFNFMRISKKKKSEDPACFDGSCLERNILNGKISIFSREVE